MQSNLGGFMKKILFVLLLIFFSFNDNTCNFATLNLQNEQQLEEKAKEKEIDTNFNGKLYLLVLLLTLPVITVVMILLVPKKTEQLIAVDLSKDKKKSVNLGVKLRKQDDDEMC